MPDLIPAILELIERLKVDRGAMLQKVSGASDPDAPRGQDIPPQASGPGTPGTLHSDSRTFSETLARLLRMPLDQFEREGQPLEIRVSWWPETLFFVPSVGDVETLGCEGIERHRVWTASELSSLLSASPWAPEHLHVLTVARRQFGGEVVQVRRRLRP